MTARIREAKHWTNSYVAARSAFAIFNANNRRIQAMTPPTSAIREESSPLPFVVPFAAYIVLMALGTALPLGPALEYPFRVVVVTVLTLVFSRRVRCWPPSRTVQSCLIGVAVFAIWIGPDILWPGYRDFWLFNNSLTGKTGNSVPAALRINPAFLMFRLFGTAVLVPVIEELFWRAWLMRYLINPEFHKVRVGFYSHLSFWLTALLFATEHGAYWDVGLAAGVIYNWWMVRNRSLADCILAHSVTNACLAAYVLGWNQWQYWP
jgi:uncharacterized protein